MLKVRIALALALTLPPVTAYAGPALEPSHWSFNGYGTVGIVHSSEDRADYLPVPLATEGPGRSGSTTLGLDSRIAAQLSVHPTPRLSAVVQTVMEQSFDGDYEPIIEWANVRYDLSPAWSVRAGRIEVDGFLVSDHRKVGFAIPWVRPPAEVYGSVPVTSSDGVDVSYQTHLGDFIYRAQVSYGDNNQYDGARAAGATFANVLEWGSATLRATYAHVELDLDQLSPLFDGLAQLGPEGTAVARRYDPAEAPMSIIALGARYAPWGSFLMGEWTRVRTDAIFGGTSGWYLSGGRRFGNLTPYLTYARAHRESGSVKGLTVEHYPAELAPLAAGFNAALAGIRDAAVVQNTWTIGARWDIAANADVKLQYDRVSVEDGSPGSFGNMAPGYRTDGADLFSLAVDFVF